MMKKRGLMGSLLLVEIALVAAGCGANEASRGKSPDSQPAKASNSVVDGRRAPPSNVDGKAGKYRALCDGGDAEACGALGAAYHDGDGVEQNYGTAAQLFQRSCDAGSASGCGRLGIMYSQSDKGLSKNTPRAVEFLRRSCDLGNPNACMGAGALLEVGDGVPKNLREAAALYERGCKGGAEMSCQLRKALSERQNSPK
jgi:TPR repeat protein